MRKVDKNAVELGSLVSTSRPLVPLGLNTLRWPCTTFSLSVRSVILNKNCHLFSDSISPDAEKVYFIKAAEVVDFIKAAELVDYKLRPSNLRNSIAVPRNLLNQLSRHFAALRIHHDHVGVINLTLPSPFYFRDPNKWHHRQKWGVIFS